MSETWIPGCSFSPPLCYIILFCRVLKLGSLPLAHSFVFTSAFLVATLHTSQYVKNRNLPLKHFYLFTSRCFIYGTSYNVTPPLPSCWPLRLDVCNEDE